MKRRYGVAEARNGALAGKTARTRHGPRASVTLSANGFFAVFVYLCAVRHVPPTRFWNRTWTLCTARKPTAPVVGAVIATRRRRVVPLPVSLSGLNVVVT